MSTRTTMIWGVQKRDPIMFDLCLEDLRNIRTRVEEKRAGPQIRKVRITVLSLLAFVMGLRLFSPTLRFHR